LWMRGRRALVRFLYLDCIGERLCLRRASFEWGCVREKWVDKSKKEEENTHQGGWPSITHILLHVREDITIRTKRLKRWCRYLQCSIVHRGW